MTEIPRSAWWRPGLSAKDVAVWEAAACAAAEPPDIEPERGDPIALEQKRLWPNLRAVARERRAGGHPHAA